MRFQGGAVVFHASHVATLDRAGVPHVSGIFYKEGPATRNNHVVRAHVIATGLPPESRALFVDPNRIDCDVRPQPGR